MLVRSLFSSIRNKNWLTIKWVIVERRVLRVQHLIVRATQKIDRRTLRVFQKLLVRSFFSRLKSIRYVTQEDTKRFIPGGDGEIVVSNESKFSLALNFAINSNVTKLRLIYFFTKECLYRSILVPTLRERVFQVLWNLALVPVVESTRDSLVYTFPRSQVTDDYSKSVKNYFEFPYSLSWISTVSIEPIQESFKSIWLLCNAPMDRQVCKGWQRDNFLVQI
uniref:Reverse transcriptase N-terminal domain-containing protein n=1 Tax=Eutreptiella pomquetensis TaxID=215699 RepID=A0A223FM25_9EUGL|nr:hypothetical protein [Eutreptiella pomquetensis]